VATRPDGSWIDRQAMTDGTWTVTATFDGSSEHGQASASCSVRVGS
jgi:hypothetical protein